MPEVTMMSPDSVPAPPASVVWIVTAVVSKAVFRVSTLRFADSSEGV